MYFRRIGELRTDRDMKQIEIAKYLGVNQGTYSDYENGKINIPIDMLIRLADLYGVSLDYLVGRADRRQGGPF
ncbi:Helix-turn-helix [Oscillibacter sp. PC13]|uniref:helix-turn-helix domain-containing protein n=1 Tax=Oscillibacter sp. PC13 TaxID=1855299 RepID=UPI0008F2C896|nr:helix-turn-helix transcriptional regulator [Oscillibacter sp. PC13]SFP47685.1 Helix-turn-helix [Oscillibacter sp. PC13]